VHDLAILIVSNNQGHWLRPCLTSVFAHAGDISLEVLVAENESRDETAAIVDQEYPGARVVASENHGFAHGNNRALMEASARYVLFLNPDTEVREGSFADLVAFMDVHPDVGMLAVRQVDKDGTLWPSARRFPTPIRALGEALASERWPGNLRELGERVVALDRYSQTFECEWTSGSFMFTRREAIESAGFMDERFFLYLEETDFCLRVRKAGWRILHLPTMTIIHHAHKAGPSPQRAAQGAYAKRHYAAKHFPTGQRAAYLGAVALRHALRWWAFSLVPRAERRRAGEKAALHVLFRGRPAPFEPPPTVAVRPRRTTP
jgi:GT2 family glycosyltransferase